MPLRVKKFGEKPRIKLKWARTGPGVQFPGATWAGPPHPKQQAPDNPTARDRLPALACRPSVRAESDLLQSSHGTLTILKDRSNLEGQFRAVLCFTGVHGPGLPTDDAEEGTHETHRPQCEKPYLSPTRVSQISSL